MSTNICNYMFYLSYLNKKLEGFFENQAPFICCKKGCSKCCQNGVYPFSKIEFEYLRVGFLKLNVNLQEKIKEKIKKIKQKNINQSNYTYECPFLINNECSVYAYRGIICRSFGLMSINPEGTTKIPFCAYNGLNYSNVLDLQEEIISEEKFKKLETNVEPVAYNVSYKFLTSENIEKNFQIDFGAKKALIEWLTEL